MPTTRPDEQEIYCIVHGDDSSLRCLPSHRALPDLDGEPNVLTEENARNEMEAAAAAIGDYPGGFDGRGIVIPAGGVRYFPCAWVNINMLRHVGCALPIELWHLGPEEMSCEMRGLVEPLGVTCVDALEVRKQHPCRMLNGWELKCYAILHSRFREVLLLDADNVAVFDPTFLFDTAEYRELGAIFWPDYRRLTADRSIWRLTGVAYRDEPEFESGQILIHKVRCWQPLVLAMWMNEHSDFWYRHIHGDKDTFHLGWRKLGREYAMPSTPIEPLCLPGRFDGVMCQHDFRGRRIFQHRNFGKWTLEGVNRRIPGFLREQECIKFLSDLQKRWLSRPGRPYRTDLANHELRRTANRLCAMRWVYERIGHDQRQMSFECDGHIAEGAGDLEWTWSLAVVHGRAVLAINGREGLTCLLVANGHDCWHGRWLLHERMPINLMATSGPVLDTDASPIL